MNWNLLRMELKFENKRKQSKWYKVTILISNDNISSDCVRKHDFNKL